MSKRVVVTGLGMVSPLGLSVEESWEGLLAARSGIGLVDDFPTDGFPTRIVAQAKAFQVDNYLDRRESRRMARFAQLAVAAAAEALRQAGLNLESEDRTRVGLQIGAAIGGLPVIEEQSLILRRDGARRINPTFVPTVIVSAGACQLAVLWGIRGPAGAPAAACATGVVALGEALRWLQRGDADVVLAGGTESAITPLSLAAFSRLGALSTRNEDPEHACRPFDAARDGTVMGEGAAIMVMETAEHACRRNAPVLAEVAGYALTEDGFHATAPEPTGDGAARAMALAIRDAGLSPDEIEYIVPHGTGTPLNDVSESRAIHRVFGERARRIPVSSNKGGIGHTLGAAGAISAVIGIKAMLENILPPTANLDTPDPECDLDHVRLQPRPARVDSVLVNAFGFGGQNACLVLKRCQGG